MFKIVFSLAVILFLLVMSEYFWKNKLLKDERARKFVHVSVGSFVAFWPWLMSWKSIQLLSLALLLGIWVAKKYNLLHALKSVKRRTYGDVTFALTIGICSTLTHNKAFFAIAILHLALADGMAAIVGKKISAKWRYKVLGQQKTLIGSMVFWLLSLWLLGLGLLIGSLNDPYHNYVLALLIIPPLATAVENLTLFGLDNLSVPISVILMLKLLA